MKFDDNSVLELVESHRLRTPEEGYCATLLEEDDADIVTADPDWARQAVRPVVGVKVAVHGHGEARLIPSVVDILGGEFASNVHLDGDPFVLIRNISLDH